MITIKNYNFDYYKYLSIMSVILLSGILLKVFDKRPYVLTETALLVFGLLFAFMFLANPNYKFSKISKIFLFYLVYLFVYNLSLVFLRVLEVDISFYDILFFSIQEFRLSTLSYYLPLLFIPLTVIEHDKIMKLFILLSKIVISYTIFEQVVSMLGFRTFFETIYFNSGVVTSNLVGVKSFGIYRIWGLVGSPQLLGVLHLITLAILLHSKEKNWAILSVICVFLSTSKTAIAILILLFFLYLLVKRRYFLIIILGFLLFLIGYGLYELNEYLLHKMINDYVYVQKIVGSVQGYFLLLNNMLDSRIGFYNRSNAVYEIPTGPLMRVYEYFSNNPLEIFFGKGITYSFLHGNQLLYTPFGQPDISDDFQFYMGLSSDYYILTFFEQYGIIGTLYLLIIYLIYPLILLFRKHNFLLYIPIIFFLATLHYPPQISKIIMIFVALSIWHIYLKEDNSAKKIKPNQVPMS